MATRKKIEETPEAEPKVVEEVALAPKPKRTVKPKEDKEVKIDISEPLKICSNCKIFPFVKISMSNGEAGYYVKCPMCGKKSIMAKDREEAKRAWNILN